MVGIVAIAITSLIYIKFRITVLLHYLLLLISAFLLTMIDMVWAYALVTSGNIRPFADIMHAIIATVAEMGIILLIPVIVVRAVQLPFSVVSRIGIVAAGAAYLTGLIIEILNPGIVIARTMDLAFVGVLVLGSSLLFKYFKNIALPLVRSATRTYLIMNTVLIPFTVLYAFIMSRPIGDRNAATAPLALVVYYLSWNLLSIIYAIRAFRYTPAALSEIPEQCIRKYSLTKREQDLLLLLLGGKSNSEISAALSVSEQTTRNYIYGLYQKTGTNSRIALLRVIQKSWSE